MVVTIKILLVVIGGANYKVPNGSNLTVVVKIKFLLVVIGGANYKVPIRLTRDKLHKKIK